LFDFKQHAENLELDKQVKDIFDPMADLLPEALKGVASIDHFTIDRSKMADSVVAFYEDYLP